MAVRLNLVVAMCNNRGIGFEGKLPWRIKGDMAFFKKVTTDTKKTGLQNAVIMGRKTWESIPEKFRPLPNRLNVVISTTISHVPEGVHVTKSFDEAIQFVQSDSLKDQLEQVFIIGGSSVYNNALQSPLCHRIYLTRVFGDIQCDTFMPEIDQQMYSLVKCPDVDSSVQKDGDLEYQFEVYDKVQ